MRYIAFILLALIACQPTSKESTSSTKTATVLQDFPLVSQVDHELSLQVFNFKFKMDTPNALKAYPHQDLPWIQPDQFNEKSGTFMSWLRKDDPINLQSPNFRLSYILKTTGQEDIYVLSDWVEQQVLSIPGSRKLSADQQVKHSEGNSALVKSLYRPAYQNRTQKYMAYAYWDFDPAYMLGLNLTTTDSIQYESLLDDFMELVQSVRK